MIKQLKMGFKMFRYTFGIKMSVGFMLLFLAVGVLLSLTSSPSHMSGNMSVFILLAGMWPVQLIYSLNVSKQVQTSTWKKAVDTSIPALMSFVFFFASYVVAFLLKLPKLGGASAEETRYMAEEMIYAGLLVVVLMLYCGFAYKLFIVATIIFFVAFVGVTAIYNVIMYREILTISFGTASVIGAIEIVLGALLQYGCSLLMYRYPLAKRAQLKTLQKYM